MGYCLRVPEFSVGGEAIRQYRQFLHENLLTHNNNKESEWRKIHEKTWVRLTRALDYQNILSNGFIEWQATGNGFNLYVDGEHKDFLYGRDDVTRLDRTFFVMGQIATMIHNGLAEDGEIKLYQGDEVYTNGNPEETYALIEHKDKDGNRRVKMLDKYTIPKDKMEMILKNANSYEEFKKQCNELGVEEHEMLNYTYTRQFLHALKDKWEQYSKSDEQRRNSEIETESADVE